MFVSVPPPKPFEAEVVYQIFPRSFRDSNGDGIGDLNGIKDKLRYIKNLGATTILLNPIFASRTYHNYFADDFYRVDPEFGTNRDFRELVRRAHQMGLKVILDIEPQYVTDRHPWFAKADMVWKRGSPFYDQNPQWWDGAHIRIATIRTANWKVRDELGKIFLYWTKAGADGFRIDHMMDDLDNKHVDTNLLRTLWQPIVQRVKALNPNAIFIGEQGDWYNLGGDILSKVDVDATYALGLRYVIAEGKREKIEKVLGLTRRATPHGKSQVLFLETHDTARIASDINDSERLRSAAVLTFTLAGTPLVYYGQELGMKGRPQKTGTDANDIPQRLAFRWNARLDAPGTARWYLKAARTVDLSGSRDHDGVSLEEQANDPGSLYRFYRRLIGFRKAHPVFARGSVERVVDVANRSVIAFTRDFRKGKVLVAVNLTDKPQNFAPAWAGGYPIRDLWANQSLTQPHTITLPRYGFRILKLAPAAALLQR